MWIFGKKRSNPAQMDGKYFEIAGMITNQDPEVMSEMKEGFAYPQKYIEKHYQHLSQDCILNDEKMKEYVMDKWWLMIDILEQHNYICTRDWKDELRDFLHFLFQTKRAISENIEINKLNLALSPEGDIPQWSRIIDEKLEAQNLVVGYIGTESDEYTVFLCTKQELSFLKKCASSINQVISYAKEE